MSTITQKPYTYTRPTKGGLYRVYGYKQRVWKARPKFPTSVIYADTVMIITAAGDKIVEEVPASLLTFADH